MTATTARLLFITDNFPPEVNAPATRTWEHCQEWTKNSDLRITILTCAPNFPQGKVFPGYKNRLWQKEQMGNIEVIRVWSFISANKGFTLRILDYISFAFAAFLAGLFIKTDIVIATSPQFFTTWTAYGLSIIKKVPWIFEVRDLWPESIKAVGAIRQSHTIELLEKTELFLYRKANRVVVVTDSFKDNLIKRGINPEKIHIVKNGSNLSLFSPRPKDPELTATHQLEGKSVITYIGTLGLAHGLDFILKSIKDLPENYHLLIIGDGAEKEHLKGLVQELKLTNVSLLPPVSKEDVPRYLALADVCLVPLRKSDTFKTVLPSKIFEAAAMEKIILLGVEGEAKALIESYQAGFSFVPEDKESFLSTLKTSMAATTDEGLKSNLKKLSQDYSREKQAKKMLDIIEQTLTR